VREQVAEFGHGSSLGVITEPDGDWRSRPAFVFLSSGILHRVGPNRLHVSIARDLAKLGFLSFRIDFSGIGDSAAVSGNASIAERWVADTRQAMDYLREQLGAKRFVLVGNCSGAAIAGLTADVDPRVAGTVLINLQGPSIYLRYYLKLACRTPAIWLRLLKGRARYGEALAALKGYLASLRRQGDQADTISPEVDVDAALRNMAQRRTKMLIVYCAWDAGFDYYRVDLKRKIEEIMPAELVRLEIIEGVDHDFKLLRGQLDLRRVVLDWAGQLQSAAY